MSFTRSPLHPDSVPPRTTRPAGDASFPTSVGKRPTAAKSHAGRGASAGPSPAPVSAGADRFPWRVHRATNQAYVVVHGQRVYLGRADKPETVAKYHRFVAEAATGAVPLGPQDGLTVKELIAHFWCHARDYYRAPGGEQTAEVDNLRHAFRPVLELYGETPAASFGPKSLMAVREAMIDRGWSRTYVNHNVARIKSAFRWAVAQELVPGSVHHALSAVAGLRRGRCRARESEPVRAVPIDRVEAIRPYVAEQVWTLIQLQLLTGARPGELLDLRPRDIDRSQEVWSSTLEHHKNAHHGHRRVIYFGPKSQDLLRPYLLRPDDAPLFSPADAERARRDAAHEARTTPMSCGNRPGTNRADRPVRPPGERYDISSYRRAIARACDRAFPPPPPLGRRDDETQREYGRRLTDEQRAELTAWQVRHRWHPNQLRHTAATLIRREFGLEAAQLTLGHASAVITDAVYAERDAQKVQQIIQAFG